MRRLLFGLALALLIATPVAWAQDSSEGTSLADNAPADNVTGSAVSARAPGNVIDFARTRHNELADARRAAQLSRDASSLLPEDTAAGNFSSSSALSSLLSGSLTGLLNTFLGTSTSTGTTTSTGTSTDSTGSSLPSEVIQMLLGAGIDLKDLNLKASDATADDKTDARSQTTTEERSFFVRWADAMLSTTFTAITVGLQTQDFIDILKDAFRPLFIPTEDESEDTSDGDSSDGDGSTPTI